MRRTEATADDPEELAIRALGFLADDPAQMTSFMNITGWTPQSLASPESRDALLLAVLDYLMRGDDLLVTFAAHAGTRPEAIASAYRKLSGDAVQPGP